MHLSDIWHSKKNDCRLSRTQVNNILKNKVMQETTVKIELGKTDVQLASTEVSKHLTLNRPAEEEGTTAYYMGIQMLFDVLKSTFKNAQT